MIRVNGVKQREGEFFRSHFEQFKVEIVTNEAIPDKEWLVEKNFLLASAAKGIHTHSTN